MIGIVEKIKTGINDNNYEIIDQQITFTDVTDRIVKEFLVDDSNVNLFQEMAGIDDPFGLFEPKLWKDKIGDSKWYCAITSVGGIITEGVSETMAGAIRECYDKFVGISNNEYRIMNDEF